MLSSKRIDGLIIQFYNNITFEIPAFGPEFLLIVFTYTLFSLFYAKFLDTGPV
jgi:hypothetical protein